MAIETQTENKLQGLETGSRDRLEEASLSSKANPAMLRIEEAIQFYRSRGTVVTAARMAGVSVQKMFDLLYRRAVDESLERRRLRQVG